MLSSKIQANAQDEQVNKVQLLLDSPKEKELIDFALAIAPNNEYSRTMDQLGVKLTKEKYTSEYHTTFSRQEIHQECNKYNLGFVQAREFKGQFSLEFLAKLKEFIKEKNIVINDYDLKTRLFVLAPRTTNLEKVTLKDNLKDPLFFWQIDSDYFVLLEGSKDYISLGNAWAGYKNRSEGTCRMAYSIENAAIGFVLFFLLGHFCKFDAISYWWLIGVALLGFLLQFIRYGIRSDNSATFNHSGWSSKKYPVS